MLTKHLYTDKVGFNDFTSALTQVLMQALEFKVRF